MNGKIAPLCSPSKFPSFSSVRLSSEEPDLLYDREKNLELLAAKSAPPSAALDQVVESLSKFLTRGSQPGACERSRISSS